MDGYVTNVERETLKNRAMSLAPGEDIGAEEHDADQFFRIEQGHGIVEMDGQTPGIQWSLALGSASAPNGGRLSRAAGQPEHDQRRDGVLLVQFVVEHGDRAADVRLRVDHRVIVGVTGVELAADQMSSSWPSSFGALPT